MLSAYFFICIWFFVRLSTIITYTDIDIYIVRCRFRACSLFFLNQFISVKRKTFSHFSCVCVCVCWRTCLTMLSLLTHERQREKDKDTHAMSIYFGCIMSFMPSYSVSCSFSILHSGSLLSLSSALENWL